MTDSNEELLCKTTAAIIQMEDGTMALVFTQQWHGEDEVRLLLPVSQWAEVRDRTDAALAKLALLQAPVEGGVH